MENFLDEITSHNHNGYMLNKTMAGTKGAPTIAIRFRSKAEVAKIKRVARKEGMSLNTFVAAYASYAADKLLASMASEVPAQPTDGATQPTYS